MKAIVSTIDGDIPIGEYVQAQVPIKFVAVCVEDREKVVRVS